MPMPLSPERRILRSRLGNAAKHGLTKAEIDELRREYRTATLAQFIQENLAKAPALTEEQKARLRILLGGA